MLREKAQTCFITWTKCKLPETTKILADASPMNMDDPPLATSLDLNCARHLTWHPDSHPWSTNGRCLMVRQSGEIQQMWLLKYVIALQCHIVNNIYISNYQVKSNIGYTNIIVSHIFIDNIKSFEDIFHIYTYTQQYSAMQFGSWTAWFETQRTFFHVTVDF